MAIGAHPDDIEFGCSGTLIKHKIKGDFVVYVCMTSTESKDGITGKILRTSEENKKETILYDITDDLCWRNRKNFAYQHFEERIKIYNEERFPYKIYNISLEA